MANYYETSNILGGDLAKRGFSFGRTYKVYTAKLTQQGTDAPVAIVAEGNTIGDIVWSRDGAGTYTGTLAGAFPEGKTFIFTGSSGIVLTLGWNSVNEVYMFTDSLPNLNRVDNILYEQDIEIRVYP